MAAPAGHRELLDVRKTYTSGVWSILSVRVRGKHGGVFSGTATAQLEGSHHAEPEDVWFGLESSCPSPVAEEVFLKMNFRRTSPSSLDGRKVHLGRLLALLSRWPEILWSSACAAGRSSSSTHPPSGPESSQQQRGSICTPPPPGRQAGPSLASLVHLQRGSQLPERTAKVPARKRRQGPWAGHPPTLPLGSFPLEVQ